MEVGKMCSYTVDLYRIDLPEDDQIYIRDLNKDKANKGQSDEV